MVTTSGNLQTYDSKQIEKIVDQIFPCIPEAAFVKSVHSKNQSKLRPWRHRDGETAKRTEVYSEAVVFIRRCFLAKSHYYIDRAELLKNNLHTDGFDSHWNISILPNKPVTDQTQEPDQCNWEEICIDDNAFPAFSDDYSFSQYLDPSILGPTDTVSIVNDNNEDSMECEELMES